MNFQEIIIKTGIMYGYPCVLFRHEQGFAWYYRGETKNIGEMTLDQAVKKFDSNFALDIRR